VFEQLKKLWGSGREATEAAKPEVAPKPILLRMERVEPLKGSPTGTEAYHLRVTAAPEAYVRLQLTMGPSRVSEHFGFAHGSFSREPESDGARFRGVVAEAWGVSGEAARIPVSLRSFEVEEVIPLDEGWKLVGRLGGRFQLTVDPEESLAELVAVSAGDARAMAPELAEVL
jgi:hypothetical protein